MSSCDQIKNKRLIIYFAQGRILLHGRRLLLHRGRRLHPEDLHPELLGALHQEQGPLPPLLPRGLVLQQGPPQGGFPQVHRLHPCLARRLLCHIPRVDCLDSLPRAPACGNFILLFPSTQIVLLSSSGLKITAIALCL